MNNPKINPKTLIIALAVASVLSIALWRWKIYKTPKKELFETKKPQKRTIKRTVDISGTLEITDNMKISSLISGTVKEIMVEENDRVKKGDILAIIDNGKGDSDVKAWQAEVDQAQANFNYAKSHFARIKHLYKGGHISHDEFEQEKASFEVYKGKLSAAEAGLEKYTIEFENTRIKAPSDGIVVSVAVSEGTGVTTALDATVLFEIAKDLCKMTAVLEVDETDIGDVKEEQDIELRFDSYRDKIFKSKISKISFSPRTKASSVSFDAEAEVNNSEQLLRPGMTVDGNVMVSQANDVLSITSQALYISKESLKLVAKKLGYKIKKLEKISSTDKTVWVFKNNTFEQRKIKTGITDDMHYQVISGISANDEVVVDVVEKNRLEELYKKHFKRF
ncbi:efflux RND transporter periplasmic adaptor subunit [Candidatus Dependentiae bacterium]